tara:strand:- start:59027 stop:59770 length:744 start_codon:yes stop_codon:yes gene_type:complete
MTKSSTLNSALPQHIAIVMDGNGRWAKKRLLPRKAGHRAGAKTVRHLIELCAQKKSIKALTLFAFSSENWQRPDEEVETLMALFMENLQKELPTLKKNHIRLSVIGERKRFSESLLQQIHTVEQETVENTGLRLNLAVSYGGRWDIVQAVKQVAEQVKAGSLAIENIDESLFSKHLTLADLPEPDLFIRSSGEQRISNFLLWQMAYAELYFTDVLWPDFNDAEFDKALAYFAKRERRFGKTSEQIGA